MINVKLVIAYDGSDYLGWQKTKEGPSIEETLQNILEQILQHPVSLQAASRTDAGVHAYGQVVNVMTSKETLDPEKLQVSLNCLLPSSIVVLHVEIMPLAFHPTLDVKSKDYHYWICHSHAQLPQHRFYSWHVHSRLDFSEMVKAASFLIGEHHFKSFCNELKNAKYDSYIREIFSIDIIPHADDRLQIVIKGNHFLYKMVRNIVGTLLYVGKRKISAEEIPLILANKNRVYAGVTAPAHGLTLFQVHY